MLELLELIPYVFVTINYILFFSILGYGSYWVLVKPIADFTVPKARTAEYK